MTEDFTGDALRYLLGEMEPDQRRAFAERLTRDPVAAQAFKTCADSLATFALHSVTLSPVSEFEREASLAGVLGQIAPKPAAPVRSPWAHLPWIWPVAAAFLLLLNLVQFVRSPTSPRGLDPSFPGNPGGERIAGEANGAPAGSTNGLGQPDTGATKLAATSSDTDRTASDSQASRLIAAESDRLEQLRREYTQLRQARDTLDADYNQILRQLARRAVTEQGIGRLAAMELVDANSYARGDRKGLTNLARELLTEPGFASVPTTPGDRGDPGAGSVGVGVAGGTLLPGGNAGNLPAESPYAWSVFDEKEHRGYLNLYNLPPVAGTDTLQVWVKPADSQEFQAVGQVPSQFHGRSGSVTYELPPGSTTPAEVLITLEPRQNRPARPTGPVVLRGP